MAKSYKILMEMSVELRQTTAKFEDVLMPYRMTPIQWVILNLVWERKLTITKLAELLEVKLASASTQVTELEKQGWVEKREGKDKRVIEIAFTDNERLRTLFHTLEGKLKKKGL